MSAARKVVSNMRFIGNDRAPALLLFDGMMQLLWPADEPVLLHADGLILREWTYEDVPNMVELFDTDQMNRWTPLSSPFDPEEAARYVEAAHRQRAVDGTLQLAITLDGDAPLGEVLAFPGSSEHSVELAYAVGATHQGRGAWSQGSGGGLGTRGEVERPNG